MVVLDPALLAALEASIAKLKAAKEACTRLGAVCRAASESYGSAKATLDAQRSKVLAASTELAGGDLADNFVMLTDDDAKALADAALKARKGIQEYARAKLLGG